MTFLEDFFDSFFETFSGYAFLFTVFSLVSSIGNFLSGGGNEEVLFIIGLGLLFLMSVSNFPEAENKVSYVISIMIFTIVYITSSGSTIFLVLFSVCFIIFIYFIKIILSTIYNLFYLTFRKMNKVIRRDNTKSKVCEPEDKDTRTSEGLIERVRRSEKEGSSEIYNQNKGSNIINTVKCNIEPNEIKEDVNIKKINNPRVLKNMKGNIIDKQKTYNEKDIKFYQYLCNLDELILAKNAVSISSKYSHMIKDFEVAYYCILSTVMNFITYELKEATYETDKSAVIRMVDSYFLFGEVRGALYPAILEYFEDVGLSKELWESLSEFARINENLLYLEFKKIVQSNTNLNMYNTTQGIEWENSITGIEEIDNLDIMDKFPYNIYDGSKYYVTYYICPDCNDYLLYKIKTRGVQTVFKGKSTTLFNMFTCPRCRRFYASVYKPVSNISSNLVTDSRLSNFALRSISYSEHNYIILLAHTEAMYSTK